MKKILISTVTLAGFLTVSAATAADLSRPYEAPPPVIPQSFSWTGFYVGLNAGYAWNNIDSPRWMNPSGSPITSLSIDSSGGFTGGIQLGYNYQSSHTGSADFVLGLETDMQYADIGGQAKWGEHYGYNYPYKAGADLSWFGTTRIRAGLAFDRTLVYATGGLAYGGGDKDKYCNYLVSLGGTGSCSDSTGFGWTLGAGMEYAFTDNLSARLEALYVNIDRDGSHVTMPHTAAYYQGNSYKSSGDTDFTVVRLGVNYKF